MPVVIPADHCQVTLNWAGSYFASGGGATVLGFRISPLESDLTGVANEVADAATTELLSFISDEVRLDTVTAVTNTLRAEVGVGFIGAISEDTCVPNSAVLTSYSTNFRGPRGRGRSYWPGMCFESSTNGFGIMTPAQTAGIQTSINNFFGQILTSLVGVQAQVILQHISDDPDRPDKTPPITPPPEVINRVVQPRLGTQRRRLRP